MTIELKMATSMEGPGASLVRGDTREFEADEAIRLVHAGFAEPTDRKAFNALVAEKQAASVAGTVSETEQQLKDEYTQKQAEAEEAPRKAAPEAAAKAIGDGDIPEDLAAADSDDGLIPKKALAAVAAAEGVEFDGKANKAQIAAAIITARAIAAAAEAR